MKYSDITPWFENRPKWLFAVFVALFLSICLFLGYHKLANLPPVGIHQWRQADGLSLANNYHHDRLDFFSPRLYNLSSDNGKAVCDCPVINYLTAVFYKLFGIHPVIFRLLTLLTLLAGFYALFRSLLLLFHDLLLASGLSVLFFASTVLAYYAFNFLPDPAALGLCLLGWWFFALYIKKKKSGLIFISLLFFTLGSLVKISYAINPLAAITFFFAEWVWGIRFSKDVKVIAHPASFFICSLLFVATIMAWNSWMLNYNSIHHSYYFLTGPAPIWKMNAREISMTWDLISNYWYTKYYYETIFHLLVIVNLAALLYWKQAGRIMIFLTLVLLTGGGCYLLLFFSQFGHHDYYALNLFTPLALTTTTSFLALRKRFPKVFGSVFVALIIWVTGLLGINYVKLNLSRRYNPKNFTENSFNPDYFTLRTYLDSAGIPGKAKMVAFPDPSPNISLYFMDRQGWTLKPGCRNPADTLDYLMLQGAEYLIISDTTWPKDAHSMRFLMNPAGIHKGIHIYKLIPSETRMHSLFLQPNTTPWLPASK